MLLNELRSNVNDLCSLMIEKGMKQARAELEIESFKDTLYIWLRWQSDSGEYRSELVIASAVEELFDQAETWIRAQPNTEERNRREYAAAIARAIDLGNKFGIEDAAINPLREVMEKLSSNVLEHHPNPTRPIPPTPQNFNDEIPF